MSKATSTSRSTLPRKPALLVFDLDYTLWPFWVDTHVTPPFKREDDEVYDAHGSRVKHYPEVPELLKQLSDDGFKIGIASRTSEIEGAESLIELFDWDQYIDYKQIFPGTKVNHFINLKKESGLEYSEMLFFDDEHRNVKDVQRIGVTSIQVIDGLTKETIEEGLREFADES